MKNLTFLILFALPFAATSQGNCSEEDLLYMGANLAFVQQAAADCGVECLFSSTPEVCFETCFSAQVPLTGPCVSCFTEQTACASANCVFACVFGTEADCAACIEANCLAGFQACAGIEDADGDGISNLTDCDDSNNQVYPGAFEIWYDGIDQNCDGANDFDQDGDGEMAFDYGGSDCNDTDASTTGAITTYYFDADLDGFGSLGSPIDACVQPPGTSLLAGDCDDSDSTIYPNAPGTGSGVDNNCNGVIDTSEELTCPGDYNSDGLIAADDLLLFLSDFGCIAGCVADLDEDGNVTSSDLLIFLSGFGTTCVQ
ncbi:MAG: hypothetical protein RL226_1400 [Bacteroidota bacterium]|jgi:hypothetical protein